MRLIYRKCESLVLLHGLDILNSPNMQLEKQYIQHGSVNVFDHSFGVACICLIIALLFHIKVNRKALIRGALLHDYFLYDWHIKTVKGRKHGFTHANCALQNANRDFELGNIEQDMIKKHMFPLNIKPPKYRESVIICIADKICAVLEIFCVPHYAKTSKKN